jgi:mersacidin/lichenicidin family type 2 lantibiotic
VSSEEIIRAWKDPEYRAGDTNHPAGEIALDQVDDHVGGTSIPCYALTVSVSNVATQFFSCFGDCEASVAHGTCAYAGSIGCC